jgi:hypothetical protein
MDELQSLVDEQLDDLPLSYVLSLAVAAWQRQRISGGDASNSVGSFGVVVEAAHGLIGCPRQRCRRR